MRILLVDDHHTFLAGSALILQKHGFSTQTASSGQEALKRIQSEEPFDLYLYDLKFPEMNGFELTERTLQIDTNAKIVILTGEDISEHYDRLIELGVCGILEKSVGELEWIASLRLAAKGFIALPLPLARKLRTKTLLEDVSTGTGSRSPLTNKELSVLKLIAHGLKNKDIAERLFMSQRNVEYHISHVFDKLQVQSRQEAVAKGIELKLLKIEG
ncbi:response regulator [Paenibacillus turpanensis]|uniref:response regulator n=1 Tax=Paenibacillus turpanensis TaxID=2689078 RepID=UPI0014082DBD|nr:response regulator transcription factor [Paenibacillus turpanensis]